MGDKARWADLFLAILLVGVAAALVIVQPEYRAGWRTGLAFLALLLVPGYLMTLTFFPRQRDLADLDRMVLSLGFSIMSVAGLGPILNVLPGRLTHQVTALGVWVWALAWALAAGLRRRLRPSDDVYLPLRQPAQVKLGALFVSAGLGVIVGLGALTGRWHANVRFTEFYMLGAQGKMADYPTSVSPGGAVALTLVVRNVEGRQLAYQIRPSRCPRVIQTPPLVPGQEWRWIWRCQAEHLTGTPALRFDLYRPGDHTPYRKLVLHLK